MKRYLVSVAIGKHKDAVDSHIIDMPDDYVPLNDSVSNKGEHFIYIRAAICDSVIGNKEIPMYDKNNYRIDNITVLSISYLGCIKNFGSAVDKMSVG